MGTHTDGTVPEEWLPKKSWAGAFQVAEVMASAREPHENDFSESLRKRLWARIKITPYQMTSQT